MTFLLAVLLLAPNHSDTTSYRTEDVRYANGDLELAALLMIPEAPGPHPAAVIIQGSGPSDRSNGWARAIAEVVAEAGYVVLLTDKRGSGASAGDWRTAGFDELAADALAGVAYLSGRSEVAGDRIGLVGLSQGGWIAPLAAARSDDVAFVVDISGAAVSFAEQSFHEMANTARQAGLDSTQVAGVLALNRAAAEYLTTGEWAPYERARTAALGSTWAPIAEGFPGAPDLPIWTFLRKVADFSPLPYWIQLEPAVLVVYGEDDEADNVPVAESVRRLESAFGAAGKRNHRIIVIPGAGHGLIRDHRLMPEFVEGLVEFLGEWDEENGH